MKGSIAKFLARRRHVREQKDVLKAVPALPCASDNLRIVHRAELVTMLESPEAGADWAQAESTLKTICRIEDGVTGGVNPGDRRAVWHLIRGFGPRSVLEVGTHVGASTVHIASALQSLARRDPAVKYRLTTVDVVDVNSETTGAWKEYGLAQSPRDMIRALGSQENVTFVTQSSLSFLETSKDRFDFIFLDGDHSSGTVYQEVPRALKLLAKDGVILLHDYFPGNRPLWSNGALIAGPYLGVTRLRREGADLEVLPLGELPWLTKLGSRTTSLAVLTRRAR